MAGSAAHVTTLAQTWHGRNLRQAASARAVARGPPDSQYRKNKFEKLKKHDSVERGDNITQALLDKMRNGNVRSRLLTGLAMQCGQPIVHGVAIPSEIGFAVYVVEYEAALCHRCGIRILAESCNTERAVP